MPIKKPNYSEFAQAPGDSAIKELEMMKVTIVSQMEGAGVKFPIKNKAELLKVFPKATPMGCSYKGKTMTMFDLISHLDDSDFPIKNAGDAAALITTRCFI
ncbi:MAG TPA: MTH865 family protein [Methanocella sp.]|uniref:MTH865 family protein n=1 Tax=Methanocella sp. TaxID=2052833 RepID=UPI002C9C8F07|nr:MTH865 family protein [Methanocella sp.]HTY90781.1 MTH865 family protein [Methanocella sp.]